MMSTLSEPPAPWWDGVGLGMGLVCTTMRRRLFWLFYLHRQRTGLHRHSSDAKAVLAVARYQPSPGAVLGSHKRPSMPLLQSHKHHLPASYSRISCPTQLPTTYFVILSLVKILKGSFLRQGNWLSGQYLCCCDSVGPHISDTGSCLSL